MRWERASAGLRRRRGRRNPLPAAFIAADRGHVNRGVPCGLLEGGVAPLREVQPRGIVAHLDRQLGANVVEIDSAGSVEINCPDAPRQGRDHGEDQGSELDQQVTNSDRRDEQHSKQDLATEPHGFSLRSLEWSHEEPDKSLLDRAARKHGESAYQLRPVLPDCGQGIRRVLVRIALGRSNQQYSAVRFTVAKSQFSKILVGCKEQRRQPAFRCERQCGSNPFPSNMGMGAKDLIFVFSAGSSPTPAPPSLCPPLRSTGRGRAGTRHPPAAAADRSA